MTTTAPSSGPTAEHARLAQATGRAENGLSEANPWYEWAHISRSAPGAPYGRTTATTATPGASFPMITRDPGPTDGMKTAWPVFRTFTMIFVWPWLFGTVLTRS